MKPKLSICLIAPVPPPYGGIANWIKLISIYNENNNEDIEFSYINTAPLNRSTEGRKLKDRIISSGFAMFKHASQLKELIKGRKIDLIHVTTSGQLSLVRDILLMSIAKSNKIPSVYHLRFGRVPQIAAKKTIEWKLLSISLKLANKVIAIDKKTFEAIKNNTKNINIEYIPNPIDINNLSLKYENNENYIMYLGWIVKSKGVEELLSAWDNIQNKYPKWSLKLVGPYSDDYFNYLKNNYSLNKVEFLGEKKHEDAMKTLSLASIFILPSYTEGFPNVVLEAMALAKPIIATSVGAIPEMLSGNSGLIIEPKNVKEITDALESLILNEEKCNILANNARNKVITEYDLSKIFTKYKKIWSSLV